MSIALETRIRPSRYIFVGMVIISVGVVVIGLMLALSIVGHNNSPVVRASLATLCFFIGVGSMYSLSCSRQVLWLSVSHHGQIYLIEDQVMSQQNASCCSEMHTTQLLSHSTVLPYFLLLRLRLKCGRTVCVPVLPDSVDKDKFRALVVAVRWIVASHFIR